MTSTTDSSLEIVKAAEFGPVNYILLVVSGSLGVIFVVGVIAIIYKEYLRYMTSKLVDFKRKLNMRRKGISGKSVQRGISTESITTSEATSYIQLTETPTSVRCSSAWTPSPVTRNFVNDRPRSSDFSF